MTALAHQLRFDLLTARRNPRARFFTFFFPVAMLVIFAGVFHGTTTVDGIRIELSRYFATGILAMSIVLASYGNVVVSIATLRESGVLKRRRATPVSPLTLVGGQALSLLTLTATMTAILLVIARALYGVGVDPAQIVALAITAAVGTVTFACLAYAVSTLVDSPESAQPLVQATTMPLWFISGVLIPTEHISPVLRTIGEAFPVGQLANGLHIASVHGSLGAAIPLVDLLALAGWGVAAVAVAVRRFSWLPSAARG
jgi:ABC-2 type transport system permease protein